MTQFSVFISHVRKAHRDVDLMIRHTNAGANDLDSATICCIGRDCYQMYVLKLGFNMRASDSREFTETRAISLIEEKFSP